MHMLPNVVDIPPCEWVNILTISERAYLAEKFINMVHASRMLDGIDTSKASASVSAVEAEHINAYICCSKARCGRCG